MPEPVNSDVAMMQLHLRFRKGRVLPYGTARLALHSTAVAQSIYGAIQEYGGFHRPKWLD